MMRTLPVLFALASVGEAGKGAMAKRFNAKWPAGMASPCDSQCAQKAKSSDIITRYLKLGRETLTGTLYDDVPACSWNQKQHWPKIVNRVVGHCPIEALVPLTRASLEAGGVWPIVGHTMVGHRRLENIESAVRSVVSRDIDGHFAELGVWRGGASIYARMVLDSLEQSNRKVFVFDAFDILKEYGPAKIYLMNSEDEVRHNFENYDVSDGVEYFKGLFQDTTPLFASKLKETNEKLAVFRIDGNFYFSYEDAMYNLYEYVPVGGVVIFDDIISHADVQKFWNDFTNDYSLPEKIHPIDHASGWFTKIKPVVLDPKLKRYLPNGTKLKPRLLV